MLHDKEHYGQHLTVRLSKIENASLLGDPEQIDGFLCELVREIDMRILAGPLVETEIGDELKYGCSGVVILYESHAAIHTYKYRRQVFLDLFSCKEFSPQDVYRVLETRFGGFEVTEETIADRGIHWSPKVDEELLTWRSCH